MSGISAPLMALTRGSVAHAPGDVAARRCASPARRSVFLS